MQVEYERFTGQVEGAVTARGIGDAGFLGGGLGAPWCCSPLQGKGRERMCYEVWAGAGIECRLLISNLELIYLFTNLYVSIC